MLFNRIILHLQVYFLKQVFLVKEINVWIAILQNLKTKTLHIHFITGSHIKILTQLFLYSCLKPNFDKNTMVKNDPVIKTLRGHTILSKTKFICMS